MSAHHRTITEFYLPGETLRIGHLVPIRPSDLINVRNKTYEVKRVTWAIDYPDELHRTARCNVDLEPA